MKPLGIRPVKLLLLMLSNPREEVEEKISRGISPEKRLLERFTVFMKGKQKIDEETKIPDRQKVAAEGSQFDKKPKGSWIIEDLKDKSSSSSSPRSDSDKTRVKNINKNNTTVLAPFFAISSTTCKKDFKALNLVKQQLT
ncbi:hypothetical protein F3Y22_tig00111273pilonHSYRG00199 [Hibiscus syriacus]|uniref:Uncharacterized protein n=1 Tax=Hibiscus syriacus TaxID=106335 RepID=A0A6A2YS25_HIBSY|nr:hypothetical protein F3Y22_tig00111273pilonHSYRG00199 [Hibiscus syriacus]